MKTGTSQGPKASSIIPTFCWQNDSNVSLFWCTTEHRVHKNGISADFKFAFLSLLGLSFRILS